MDIPLKTKMYCKYTKRTSKYFITSLKSPLLALPISITLIYFPNINLNLMDFTYKFTTLLKSQLRMYRFMITCHHAWGILHMCTIFGLWRPSQFQDIHIQVNLGNHTLEDQKTPQMAAALAIAIWQPHITILKHYPHLPKINLYKR